jgi:uncharacterized protein YqgV (UPF0045/DUF77 family)
MRITADLSLYPLQAEYVPAIIGFIDDLADTPGIDVVVNQLSTQLNGEADIVIKAVGDAMKRFFATGQPASLVVKYLNADIDIATRPSLGRGAPADD